MLFRKKTHRNEEVSDNAGPKPFQLVKFFSYASFTVILFSAMTLSWFISNHAKDVLIKRSEAYVLLLAEKLNQQIYQQFALPTIVVFGRINLRDEVQSSRLDWVVRSFTKGLQVEAVSIYDSAKNIVVYSTIAGLAGAADRGGDEYRQAATGKSASLLEMQGSILSLAVPRLKLSCRIRTFFPIIDERAPGKSIMGVTEVLLDLSEDMKAIVALQAKIILASFLVMTLLFAVLRLIVARADRIIAARNEERRQLTEQLHQAERLAGIGTMVATVAHEIKNPLGIIRSTGELLAKRMKENESAARLAAIIVEETSRLNRIVVEFLEFAKPQSPRRLAVDVGDILGRALDFLARDCLEKKIEIVFPERGSHREIHGDPDLLYRAFLNIFLNAIQSMGDGGLLTVRSREGTGDNAGRVHIEIGDSGAGIPPQDMERIFTPFFTTRHRGTGLGLAIVKNIIDSHEGEIRVESEVGTGTRFHILLP